MDILISIFLENLLRVTFGWCHESGFHRIRGFAGFARRELSSRLEKTWR